MKLSWQPGSLAADVVKGRPESGQSATMNESEILAYCDGLPGATRDHPFGPETEVWKVGDRIFALMATGSGHVSLRCASPDYAEMLVSAGRAGKGPHLPRGGWIAVDMEKVGDDEMLRCLRESYDTVRSGLPEAVRTTLT